MIKLLMRCGCSVCCCGRSKGGYPFSFLLLSPLLRPTVSLIASLLHSVYDFDLQKRVNFFILKDCGEFLSLSATLSSPNCNIFRHPFSTLPWENFNSFGLPSSLILKYFDQDCPGCFTDSTLCRSSFAIHYD